MEEEEEKCGQWKEGRGGGEVERWKRKRGVGGKKKDYNISAIALCVYLSVCLDTRIFTLFSTILLLQLGHSM